MPTQLRVVAAVAVVAGLTAAAAVLVDERFGLTSSRHAPARHR